MFLRVATEEAVEEGVGEGGGGRSEGAGRGEGGGGEDSGGGEIVQRSHPTQRAQVQDAGLAALLALLHCSSGGSNLGR
jgi:hypothetical protein